MKFRKRPIIVEAEQFHWGKHFDGVVQEMESEKGLVAYIITLEGKMMISPGDWIITGVNNEKYPCKNDIFEKTYEFVG